MSLPFTHKELEELSVSNLRALAKYYDIEFTSKTTKEKLIKLVWEVIRSSPSSGVSTQEGTKYPEMSVRVRRIYEARMKGEL